METFQPEDFIPTVDLTGFTPELGVFASDMSKMSPPPESPTELPKLGSVIPALPTLYHSDGAINLTAAQDMIAAMAQEGIKSVLGAGTTGEATLMTHDEQIRYIQEVVRIARKYSVQVVAGTGANTTTEEVQLTQAAKDAGADACLLLPPYYIKSSPDAMLAHFWEALNIMPGIIYSIKGRTGIQIPLEVLYELQQHPHFIGVKECDGAERIRALADRGIRVWSGEDSSVYWDVHESGAGGVVTVVGNMDSPLVQSIVEGVRVVPADIQRMINLAALAFPPGLPNPGSIHNITEMRRLAGRLDREGCAGEAPGFRDVIQPFDLVRQQTTQRALAQLGIHSAPFGDSAVTVLGDRINRTPRY